MPEPKDRAVQLTLTEQECSTVVGALQSRHEFFVSLSMGAKRSGREDDAERYATVARQAMELRAKIIFGANQKD